MKWTSLPSSVAYFSMEIGLEAKMPTYSGGLGLLAGDTLRAAADLGVPMIGMTLLYRKGYFQQKLDAQGNQSESPSVWDPKNFLELLSPKVTVTLENRPVQIQAWRYVIKGHTGETVPVYFLDTDLPENDSRDRALSGSLYSGDEKFRLSQEAVLGLGGIAMLRALGHKETRLFHMNEGHSALLTLALLTEHAPQHDPTQATDDDRESVRQQCLFTTHTPVPAGHDQFPSSLVREVLGEKIHQTLVDGGHYPDGVLNMTYLALASSRYVNGVAMRHGIVSRGMFPEYPVDSITNGVHAASWVSPSFAKLLDHHVPNWRWDNFYLRHAICIPLKEIRAAHLEAKRSLLAEVKKRTKVALSEEYFTLGFARRATAYKRADLLFSQWNRLTEMSKNIGPIQILYAGKAHPKDQPGKALIRRIFQAAEALTDKVRVLYLEDYDIQLGKLLCAGVDVWLNTPQKPQEASGTSGMKAALNGVPSLSILDGWWVEGHLEGITGWSIGEDWKSDGHQEDEVISLYDQLEKTILPLYYHYPDRFDQIRQSCVAVNGSFFNAQRMLLQYCSNAYARG